MIRVIVVDDHLIMRRGMRQLLEESGDIEVVGEAGDYAQLMQRLRGATCDVLLLDISVPGKNGIEIVKVLRELYPSIRVLILTMYPEEQYAVRAFKAGALGYLTKSSAPESLVEAVRQIASGRRFVTPRSAEALAGSIGEDARLPHELLSDREFQTLRLLAGGMKLSEIANELSLSPKTVSVYRARVLEKMKLGSTAELATYAERNGLLD
jgi:DNA-binding NarL/FixJ family response regulator